MIINISQVSMTRFKGATVGRLGTDRVLRSENFSDSVTEHLRLFESPRRVRTSMGLRVHR